MDTRLNNFQYSKTVHVPRSVLWDVFDDPVACILTFFHEYTHAHNSGRNVYFEDEEGFEVTGHVWRNVAAHDKSELGTKFSTPRWGSISVHMLLADKDAAGETTDTEFLIDVSGINNEHIRQQFLNNLSLRYEKCLYYIHLRATLRHGSNMKYSVQINCPRHIIWADMSDWNNIEWVKGATAVQPLGDNKRRVFAGKRKSVVNMLVDLSEDTLVYEIITSEVFDCSFYRGVVCLKQSKSNPRATNLYYKNLWLPLKMSETSSVRATLQRMFVERFTWLKAKYEAKAAALESSNDRTVLLGPAAGEGAQPLQGDDEDDLDSGADDPGVNLVPPVMQGKHKIDQPFTVRAPIDDVWEIVQDFGPGAENWWSEYKFLSFEDDADKQFIGCVRKMARQDQVYRDKLIFLSPNDYRLMWETVGIEPNPYGLEHLAVMVFLEPGHENPEDETEVVVTTSFDCMHVLKPTMEEYQREIVEKSVAKLKENFQKVAGTIEVTLVRGENLALDQKDQIDLYCTLCIQDYPLHPEVSKSSVCQNTSNPKWNESFDFSVSSTSVTIAVAVWDKKKDSDDKLLGVAQFTLPSFSKTPDTSYKVPISTGHLMVKSKFKWDHRPPVKGATKPEISKQLNHFRSLVVENFMDFPLLRYDKFQWKALRRLEECPEIPLENLPGFCEAVPHAERLNPAKTSKLMEELTNCVASFRGHVTKDEIESRIENLYCKYLPQPKPNFPDFLDDSSFCQRFLNGPVVNVVRCVSTEDQIPDNIKKLCSEEKLNSAMEKNSLFLVEFEPLRKQHFPAPGPRYSPVMLFQGSRSRGFEIVGIALSKGDEFAYGKESPSSLLDCAKLFLQNAAIVYHLYFNVVLRNLMLESVAFAIHMNLEHGHPLRKLLLPVFSEICHKARFLRALLLDSSFPEYLVTCGKENAIDMIARNAKKYHIYDSFFNIPKDLQRRGFTNHCSGYQYQDDSLRLWDTLETHIGKYVNKVYSIDRNVESDTGLHNFLETLSDLSMGNCNFPHNIANKSGLSSFLTGLIFSATAQSSAFEKNLYDEACLLGGTSTMIKKHMPVEPPGLRDGYQLIDHFFPPNDESFLQMLLLKTLSVNSAAPIAEAESVLGHKFTDDLLTMSTHIKERNAKANSGSFRGYTALDPFNVPSVAGM